MAKTLHYNFDDVPSLTGTDHPGTLTPDLTLTRATTAMMVDADGYLRTVQSGEPRFDGATFRHNLQRDSNIQMDIGGEDWAVNNGTATKNAIANPVDGTVDGAKIAGNGASTVTRLTNSTIDYGKEGHTYLFSVYAKAGDNISWSYIGTSSGDALTQYYDLVNGVLGATGNNSGAGMEDVGNGWYRCWLIWEPTTDAVATINLYSAEGDNDVGFPSNIDSTYFYYLYGFMAEDISGTSRTTPSDYIPTTTAAVTSLSGANNGLQVEEARTNICLQSEDFSTTWVEGLAASTFNQTTAPDGTSTADRLLDDGLGGSGAVHFYQGATHVTSTKYCLSVFAKADQLSWLHLRVISLGTLSIETYFNLSAGAVGTEGADVISSGIEDYGNGWYRCWMTYTSDATDTAGTISIRLADADGDNSVDRDGTSSIFVWGAQLEAGGTALPTSYIPTTTVSVTRNADNIQTSDVSWYNQPAGTFYVGAQVDVVGTGSPGVPFELNDNSSSDRWLVYANAADAKGRFDIVSSAGDNASLASAGLVITAGTLFRMVSGCQDDDAEFYVDGTRIGTGDQTLDMPTNFSTLNVGSNYAEAQHLNGLIKELAYFDERLDNTVLDAMSTYGLLTPTGWAYPRDSMPTDEARFQTFIDATGITSVGSLQGDYRKAMATVLGVSEPVHSINDLAKKLDEQNG